MKIQFKKPSSQAGFTIAEVIICFTIMALVMSGTLLAYTQSSKYAERAGYALAAQTQAVQVLERVRAAMWDIQATPVIDQTTNVPLTTVTILDLPISGTNAVYATNKLSVTTLTVSANPPSYVKIIQVNTTWLWDTLVMSNTMVAYRAPDQ